MKLEYASIWLRLPACQPDGEPTTHKHAWDGGGWINLGGQWECPSLWVKAALPSMFGPIISHFYLASCTDDVLSNALLLFYSMSDSIADSDESAASSSGKWELT